MKCISEKKEQSVEFRIEDAFEKYKNRVFAVGFSHFKNSTDADDIVQETFYRLYRRGSEFESDNNYYVAI